jgi:hypothetical protein
MNGNPELNVDAQYAAFTQIVGGGRVMWRAFGLGYHDGRTGVTKTDNRPLPARAADHENIRIGTYGGNLAAVVPAGGGQFDFMAWGVGQNGSWGRLDHRAGAAAAEAGFRMVNTPTAPWIRGGWFRATGDRHPTDGRHNTFFQVLTTPRIYARDPFYNLMNSSDEFVQLMDKPSSRLVLRSDLHWLQLTSNQDLWYQGGGAFDNKVFGYVGRPSQGAGSFASVADISADYRLSSGLDLTGYYSHTWGRTVIRRIYPAGASENFGYCELNYRWGREQKGSAE